MSAGGRLASLDTQRGFDMMFIMGAPACITLALAASGCGQPWLEDQFRHVVWHGLHFQDTIFPLFLFLAGVSWPFSLAKRRARGDSRAAVVRKIAVRCATLVLLGCVYNGVLKLDFPNMVWGSVLSRIGIAWAAAAAMSVFVGTRKRVFVAAAILLAHWATCVLVSAPDAPGLDPLSRDGCFAGWLDRVILPGRLTVPGVISNQGVFSTFTAIVTAMLGVFAGELLRRDDLSGGRKAGLLAAGAAGMAACGTLAAYAFGRYSIPFNKILWSSSFVLVVGGYSAAMLSLFYWLVDVKGWWRRTLFFRVIGMNSITIYMMNCIMGFGVFAKFFLGGFAGTLPPEWGSVVLAAGTFGFEWLFLYFLHCKNTFLRV